MRQVRKLIHTCTQSTEHQPQTSIRWQKGGLGQEVGVVGEAVGVVCTPLEVAMSRYSMHSSQTSVTSNLG